MLFEPITLADLSKRRRGRNTSLEENSCPFCLARIIAFIVQNEYESLSPSSVYLISTRAVCFQIFKRPNRFVFGENSRAMESCAANGNCTLLDWRSDRQPNFDRNRSHDVNRSVLYLSLRNYLLICFWPFIFSWIFGSRVGETGEWGIREMNGRRTNAKSEPVCLQTTLVAGMKKGRRKISQLRETLYSSAYVPSGDLAFYFTRLRRAPEGQRLTLVAWSEILKCKRGGTSDNVVAMSAKDHKYTYIRVYV